MKNSSQLAANQNYKLFASDIERLLADARRLAARSVNAVLTATYWEVGRRIVKFEQHGRNRATYGDEVIERLSGDLTRRLGRGFGVSHVKLMRQFYLAYAQSGNRQSLIGQSSLPSFPLSWTHYARLLRVENNLARSFYESEALRGGWSVRQLDRQIESQFYERTALSRNKVAMLRKGSRRSAGDALTPEDEIKDPYLLEFLGLKDEYYHRRLRSLVLVDLKIGTFTHADAGQMHLYLNYAKAHWTFPEENPPVGLILCAEKDAAVAQYALEGLPNKVMASKYKTALPKEKELVAEMKETQRALQAVKRANPKHPGSELTS